MKLSDLAATLDCALDGDGDVVVDQDQDVDVLVLPVDLQRPALLGGGVPLMLPRSG